MTLEFFYFGSWRCAQEIVSFPKPAKTSILGTAQNSTISKKQYKLEIFSNTCAHLDFDSLRQSSFPLKRQISVCRLCFRKVSISPVIVS